MKQDEKPFRKVIIVPGVVIVVRTGFVQFPLI